MNILPALLLCLLCLPAAAADGPVRVATSQLPPLAIEHVQERPGALYELVTELAKRAAMPIKIDFVPWQRAIFMSKQARTAIFPLTRNAEREQQYRWLARLYGEQMIFVGMKARFDPNKGPREKHLRVAALRGSIQVQWLKEAGFKRIVETASVRDSLRYLQGGMVDAVYGNADILHSSIKAVPADPAAFSYSETRQTSTTWLAGSLDFSEAEVAQFNKALQSMHDDGSYQKILQKYELTPLL